MSIYIVDHGTNQNILSCNSVWDPWQQVISDRVNSDGLTPEVSNLHCLQIN